MTSSKIPDVLFHLTPAKNLESILQVGLIKSSARGITSGWRRFEYKIITCMFLDLT